MNVMDLFALYVRFSFKKSAENCQYCTMGIELGTRHNKKWDNLHIRASLTCKKRGILSDNATSLATRIKLYMKPGNKCTLQHLSHELVAVMTAMMTMTMTMTMTDNVD